MALSAYSPTNTPLPDPQLSIDYGNIGTATATDATGVSVNTSKYFAALLAVIDSSFTGDIIIWVSDDGTNYFKYETVTTPGANFYRWLVGWNSVKVTVANYTSGSASIRVKRIPWQMAGSLSGVGVGP